ncbi:MAG: tetratricopeptide repeat protein [Phycisphaeraceae bacterium]
MRLPEHPARKTAVLLLPALLILLGGAGYWFMRPSGTSPEDLAAHRRVGMAAYEAGDHETAIEELTPLVARPDADAEALEAWARARLRVPLDGNAHLGQAAAALARASERRPDDVELARQVLELQQIRGDTAALLRATEHLLELAPNDRQALRARAAAKAAMGQTPQALADAEAAAEQAPLDWQIQLLRMDLARSAGTRPHVLVEQASELHTAHPDDPRADLILGYAHHLAGNDGEAARWLSDAAKAPPTSPAFAAMLVRYLDAAGLYDESLTVLERAAEPQAAPAIYQELLARRVERGDAERVAQHLQNLPIDNPRTPVKWLAWRAWALGQTGQTGEAERTRAALRRRKEPEARAWAAVLEALGQAGPDQPGRMIPVLRQALAVQPGEAFFHQAMGEARATTGELELARDAWQRAAEHRPHWAEPRAKLAQVLLELGYEEQALESARAAIARQPSSVEAMIALALAAGKTEDRQGIRPERLLELARKVQQARPGEPRTLLLQIDLLARQGRQDEAAAAAQQAMNSVEPPEPALLRRLAQLNREHELGLDEDLARQVERTPETAAEKALAEAMALARQGQAEAGLAQLESAMPDQPDLAWRVARAKYLEATRQGGAKSAWRALLEEHPRRIGLIREALRAESVAADAELATELIDRLRELTGDSAATWRLAKARWLLTRPADASRTQSAVELLEEGIARAPGRAEPRLLLAVARKRLGDESGALRQLEKAARLQPERPELHLELARLHQQMRQFPQARQRLQRAVAGELTRPQQLAAARLLTRQADYAAAAELLEPLADELTGRDRLRLARCLVQIGRAGEAEAALAPLLEAEAPPAEAIVLLAQARASRGDRDQARQALDQLAETDLTQAEQARARARHFADLGDTDAAAAAFREAADAEPGNSAHRRRLVAYLLLEGETGAALAAARDGSDDARLHAALKQAERLGRWAEHPAGRKLLASLVGSPARQEAAIQAIQALGTTRSPGSAAAALQPIAQQQPDWLELKLALAELELAAGRADAATERAMQAMERFPHARQAAELACEAAAEAGRWTRAMWAADRWRKLAIDPIRADRARARARLELGRPNEAIRTLEPYRERAARHPERYAELLGTLGEALIAAGRANEARKALLPLLTSGPQGRRAWIELTSRLPGEAEAASWLEEAAAHVPGDAPGERIVLASAWREIDRPERAKQALRPVLDRAGAPPEAWRLAGEMAEREGERERAIRFYRRAVSGESLSPEARMNLAKLLTPDPETRAEAQALLEEAIRVEPGEARWRAGLAELSAANGQWEEAVELLREATRLEPRNPYWRQEMDRVEQAAEAAER